MLCCIEQEVGEGLRHQRRITPDHLGRDQLQLQFMLSQGCRNRGRCIVYEVLQRAPLGLQPDLPFLKTRQVQQIAGERL